MIKCFDLSIIILEFILHKPVLLYIGLIPKDYTGICAWYSVFMPPKLKVMNSKLEL